MKNENLAVTNGKDPSYNVREMLETAVQRIDDLRNAETTRVNELIVSIKELMVAESKRIDAIRLVDTQGVQTANEKATAQATVLASQVATSADTLRALVATTAASVALQLDQLTKQLTDRLSLLEKSQYEGMGKSGVTDPMFNKIIEKLDSLNISRSEVAGQKQGIDESFVKIIAIVGATGVIVGIVMRFVV